MNNFEAIVAMNLKLAMSCDHSTTLAKNSKPCPFPVWAWQVCKLPVVENQLFYTSGLTATTSDRRLFTALSMGFVKQKA